MKKLLIVLAIVVFTLFHYGLLSLNKGFVKFNESDDSFANQVKVLTSIEKVKYYKNFIQDQKEFILIIETKDANYMMTASRDDISSLSVISVVFSRMRPQEMDVLPIWVCPVVLIVILAIPFKKREIITDIKELS